MIFEDHKRVNYIALNNGKEKLNGTLYVVIVFIKTNDYKLSQQKGLRYSCETFLTKLYGATIHGLSNNINIIIIQI